MSAYMVPSSQTGYSSVSEEDDVSSLPSETATESDLETLSDYSDAEAEWRESIEQLELLLTMVLVPFIGKYLGRRCAYWGTSYLAIRLDPFFLFTCANHRVVLLGWTRFMEWKYPVEVVIRNPKVFKGAGVIEAAATL